MKLCEDARTLEQRDARKLQGEIEGKWQPEIVEWELGNSWWSVCLWEAVPPKMN
jgi:hypothetical protein